MQLLWHLERAAGKQASNICFPIFKIFQKSYPKRLKSYMFRSGRSQIDYSHKSVIQPSGAVRYDSVPTVFLIHELIVPQLIPLHAMHSTHLLF